MKVRTRVAPSPTGDPHVGTAYVALFSYAYAKKHHGSFILRIDDTDQARSTKSSENAIMEALRWLGLNWDEGPDVGGWCGPYRQSERLDLYKKAVQRLIDNKHAYYCFCSPDRLSTLRDAQRHAKLTLGYDKRCRFLYDGEVKDKLASGAKYVVRLAVPTDGTTTYKDEIRGEVSINNALIDDQILIKSDGFPTYHLASVVDDHLMDITHIIRAEEWMSSTPKHVLLYKFLGWHMPQFIHVPLLRNSNKSKISKRENATSILYYREAGYLPEALRNFLSNMGCSFGGDREIYTLDEFINTFSFSRISLGAPVFDINKLNNLNSHYLRSLTPEQLFDKMMNWKFNSTYFKPIFNILKPRIKRLDEIIDNSAIFFNTHITYSGIILPNYKTAKECISCLSGILDTIDLIEDWEHKMIYEMVISSISEQWAARDIFHLLRLVMMGKSVSLPITETMEILGKDLCKARINNFISYLDERESNA